MQTFGRYTVVDTVGVGGTGTVYLVELAAAGGFKKKLALKVIHESLVPNEESVARFIHEARVAAEVTHPNLVQVFDFGDAAGRHYLVMEWIDGVSLHQVLEEVPGPMPIGIALGIAAQVGRGLRHAHAATGDDGLPLDLVHRDLNPKNVLIAASGTVKVADWGLAKTRLSVAHTRTGLVQGTLRYMAPEQARAQVVDGRADQFSLALMVYEMLSGKQAYTAVDQIDLLEQARGGTLVALDKIAPLLPRALTDAVGRALSVDPSLRFPDIGAFVAALEETSPQRPAREEELCSFLDHRDKTRVSPPPGSRRSRVSVAVIAAGLLAAIGLAFALRGQHSASPEPVDTPLAKAPTLPEPEPAPMPAPSPQRGWLSVNSREWANVFVDDSGEAHQTPVARLPLSPGPHRIRLRYGWSKKEKILNVEILPGQTTKLLVPE